MDYFTGRIIGKENAYSQIDPMLTHQGRPDTVLYELQIEESTGNKPSVGESWFFSNSRGGFEVARADHDGKLIGGKRLEFELDRGTARCTNVPEISFTI